ncbi:MAG: penicillin-binding protein [Bacteroidales bacterium]
MMEGSKGEIVFRFFWIYLIIFIGFLCVIGRIAYIQVVEGGFWRKLAAERFEELRPVQAKRGSIYSVDSDTGELLMLATDVPKYDVYIDLGYTIIIDDKTHKKNKKRVIEDSLYKADMPILCERMAALFANSKDAKTKSEYLSYFRKFRNKETGNRYVLLQKNITLDQWDHFRKFPLIANEKLKKNKKTNQIIHSGKFYLSNAINVVERNVRYYPYYPMARRTIGVPLSGCDTCYDGIDGFYSKYLVGESGMRKERKINPGIWIPVDDNEQIKAIDGNDIVTTIDVRLQELAENSLKKCLDSNDAESGCVILMEVKTGNIRAISSLQRTQAGEYIEARNIAINDYFESGSTFKTISAMLFIDKGMVDTAHMVPTFSKRFPGTVADIVDVGNVNHGMVSFGRAMEMSSNVGVSQVVYDNYIATGKKSQFRKDLMDYFYFKKLNMDIKTYEPTPYINSSALGTGDILRLSFGYISMISPIQLLTFYNGIANNGVMVRPMFVSQILKEGKVIKKFEPVVLKDKMCKKETLDILQDILKRVVEHGTGKKLSKTAYGIAGKTGTAEIGYSKRGIVALQHRASFAGYFPANNPQYSCIVVISEPHKNATHGGDLAAPVFKDLSDRVVGTRISYQQPTSAVQKQVPDYSTGNVDDYNKFCYNIGMKTAKTNINWQPLKKSNIVPNVVGMTIRDALYLLEKQGLKVSFEGKGKVIGQSFSSGSSFANGNKIHLQLGN